MPRQTEPNANNALGDLLRSMMPRCQVRSETPRRNAACRTVTLATSPAGAARNQVARLRILKLSRNDQVTGVFELPQMGGQDAGARRKGWSRR